MQRPTLIKSQDILSGLGTPIPRQRLDLHPLHNEAPGLFITIMRQRAVGAVLAVVAILVCEHLIGTGTFNEVQRAEAVEAIKLSLDTFVTWEKLALRIGEPFEVAGLNNIFWLGHFNLLPQRFTHGQFQTLIQGRAAQHKGAFVTSSDKPNDR